MRQLAAVAAAAGIILPSSTFPRGPISAHASHAVPRLSAVVSRLAGVKTTANCWSRRDWTQLSRHEVVIGNAKIADAEAFALRAFRLVQIGPQTCGVLARIIARRPVPEVQEANAIQVIAHEAQHIRGVRAENEAECGGIRALPQAARLLGVPGREAVRLQHVFRGSVYPFDEPAYRTPACAAGLPGVVISADFGAERRLAALRNWIRSVVRILPAGWRELPAPHMGLSTCAVVKSYADELTRAERIFASPNAREYVDVVAVQFRSADGYLRAVSAIPAAHRCTAATVRRTIRKVDPRASVRLTGLSLAVPRTRALADRLVERSQTLQLATVLVVDHVFVFDPARRRFLDVVLRSFGRPPPVALERAALAAALR